MKRNNKKIKNFLQNDIILNEDVNIYIVILVNNHAISCTENYIFDTSFMTINIFETVIVYSKRHKKHDNNLMLMNQLILYIYKTNLSILIQI